MCLMLACGASDYYPVVPVTSTRLQYPEYKTQSHRNHTQYPVHQIPSTRHDRYCANVVDKLQCCDQSYTIGGERGRWYNRVLLAPLGSGFLPVVCPGYLLCCTVYSVHLVYLGHFGVLYLGHFGVLWCTYVPGVMYLALHCALWCSSQVIAPP